MKASSAKAKGRRLQNRFVEAATAALHLEPGDLRPAIMGETGEDIKRSPAGRRAFRYSVECKNQEALNVWSAMKQAKQNAGPEDEPLLVFTRNHEDVYAVVRASHLLELLAGKIR